MKNGNIIPSQDTVDTLRNTDFPGLRDRLESLRKQHGYSKTHVANAIGCTYRTYNTWVNGKTKGIYPVQIQYNAPSLDYLIALAELYGVSLDYLTGRIDCTSVDNQMIHDITGLSDGAIDKLKKCRNHPISSYAADIINILLTSEKAGR